MIFRQLFDSASGTYSYLLASRKGGEALIIDPVLEKVDRYLQLINELDLKLVKAIDAHLHADHVTALGALRDRTLCITVMGEKSKAHVVSMRVKDGDRVTIDGLSLGVIYTPGHTDDSYSFTMADRVFTGDTLLIRGTGRTDFQNGDPRAQYESIFNRLLKLPNSTLVYPAHDYKGETANTRIGLSQGDVARRGWAITMADFSTLIGRDDVAVVDIRENGERETQGVVPDAIHVPYPNVAETLRPGGALSQTAETKQLVFVCAYGERSAMAVQLAQSAGLAAARHLHGGLAEWRGLRASRDV